MTGRRRHSFGALAFVATTLILGGCYASTEPATDVASETATLRGQGTANNGPAGSWFEYWVTGSTANPRTTESTQWPSGASGAFSQKVKNLAAGSSYSFRVCGTDSDTPACAQTRTFTTAAAVEDSAEGGYDAGCCASFRVDARSGPAGESPHGSMSLTETSGQTSTSFTGFVTCLAVDGRTAKVGAVGARRDLGAAESTPARLLVALVDGHTQADSIERSLSAGSTPPSCSAAPPFGQVFEHGNDEIVVNDAQA
jgi:hypothetical protein